MPISLEKARNTFLTSMASREVSPAALLLPHYFTRFSVSDRKEESGMKLLQLIHFGMAEGTSGTRGGNSGGNGGGGGK